MKKLILVSVFTICSFLPCLISNNNSAAFFGYGRLARINYAIAGDSTPYYATCCKSSFAMDCARSADTNCL